MKPWTERHAPKKEDDLIGQREKYAHVKRQVAAHQKGKRPILLTGPTGVGKTSLAYVLAYELDCELIEVNASDTRNKDEIERVLGGAAMQRSLFFRGRIILVDEVDGVSGVKDRGAMGALVDLAAKSGHPIIFTATDADDEKLKPLRKAAELVTLAPATSEEIAAHLAAIAAREDVAVEHEQLLAIARRAGGDIRAAMNDLQSVASGGSVTKEDVAMLSDREQEVAIEQALLRVFKTTSAEVALPAFDYVTENPERIIYWMEENLPKEYTKPADLARAMDAVAEADRFFGRIRRWQYYRYYVYMTALLSAGVALAKTEKYKGAHEYKRPGLFLSMWIYNQKNAKRKRLAEQLAPHLHTSRRRVQQDVLPYLKAGSKALKRQVREAYNLDEEASAWLEG